MSERFTRRRALEIVLAGGLATALPGRTIARAARGREGSADTAVPVGPQALSPAGDGWFESVPLDGGAQFEMLGVSWSGSSPGPTEVSLLQDGRWGPWIALRELGSHVPDGVRAARASEPLWVGSARRFRLRVRRRAPGLAARLVSAGPDPRTPARMARAHVAGPPEFAVMSRRAWGAQAPRVRPSYGEVKLAFVHHTVSANSYSAEQSPALVRSIQHYHRNVLGWDDIGYQALVDRFGQLFEGRAGGIDLAVIGAQAQGWNAQSTGIAVIGTHTTAPVAPAVVDSLARYLAWKLAVHHAKPKGKARVISAGGETARYPKGTRVRLPRISGHRHGNLTECPGDALFAQLPRLRRRVTELTELAEKS